MEVLTGILSAFGLSASAGLNAYIPLLVVALLARFTNLIQLNSPWDTLTSWWIIGILVVLCLIEFFADKVPAVNHINDIIQTFVRPVAGAIIFAASAQVITDIHPVLAMGLGLFVAGSVHAVKALAVRPAVTATTGGTANIPVSIAEDVVATILSVLSVVLPVVITAVVIILTALVLYWIWRRTERQRVYKTQ
ncbi:MAG: DUF4126 domain-containing protein [Chloroflexota bacterium]|nr:MAG: DUF4126 domain-containing protein [Chloroflexota bacterium]